MMGHSDIPGLLHLKEKLSKNIPLSKRFRKNLVLDHLSQALIPSDLPKKWEGALAYKTKGDRNCLFNSVSLTLTGCDSLATSLRKATAIELYVNVELYLKV